MLHYHSNIYTKIRSLILKQSNISNKKDRIVKVGNFDLLMPADHTLEVFKKSYKRYDLPLEELAEVLATKYPQLSSIDIGANVGASAVSIYNKTGGKVLCIEGDLQSLPYLQHNLKFLNGAGILAECFIGRSNAFIDVKNVQRPTSGSGSFTAALTSSKTAHPVESLTSVLKKLPLFLSTKLLKIDTDGFDFEIICDSLELLATMRPVLFFEFAPDYLSQNTIYTPISTMKELTKVAYKAFVVFDNFGNFLLSTKQWESFIDLTFYLKRNTKSDNRIFYYDVCAFHEEDLDLFTKFVHLQHTLTLNKTEIAQFEMVEKLLI